MLLTTSEYVKSMGLFVRVWRNEFTRVICDRLISVEVGSVLLSYKGACGPHKRGRKISVLGVS
jgi:hypothetical protein